MSTAPHRLQLFVDVFHEKNQRALVLPEIRPQAFIQAILQEFRQARMEFLGDDPDAYQLVRADDETPLNPEIPLGEQLQQDDHLILVERMAPLPPGAQRPSRALYLRELATNHVFRVQWVPAIIGRPDPSRPDDALLAVNLRHFETGLRVSRRHAQIFEQDETFYIKSLSQNPTSLVQGEDTKPIPVTSTPLPIHHGDLIILDRSNITLKVLFRDT